MKPERTQDPWTLDLPGWRFEQKDRLCRSFVFAHSSDALDFVIDLCRLARKHELSPSFRAREGHVFVQCSIPAEGADDSLFLFAKDLNDLQNSMP